MATAKESRIREGLAKAALHPEGLPIQSHRTTNGLFTSSKEGREAQETCLKSGWLEMSADSSEARITTLGWNHLASDPRLDLVFSELLRQIDSWRDQDRLLVQRVREHLSRLDHLRETVNLLTQPQKASPQLPIESHLQHLSKPGVDVPLPVLFESILKEFPMATIGNFHDSLRLLKNTGRIHLHAWTGSLHDIPYPETALMAGHDIAYYASLPNSVSIAMEGSP
ncbi:MAG: hypothetical protein EBS53_15565 [Bacteroidetes bacterium]|nr:hypothetical protein [Bacteroidota bacterium]